MRATKPLSRAHYCIRGVSCKNFFSNLADSISKRQQFLVVEMKILLIRYKFLFCKFSEIVKLRLTESKLKRKNIN